MGGIYGQGMFKEGKYRGKSHFWKRFLCFCDQTFLLPGNLMTGGTTGIGLVVKHFTGASISGFVLAFNIVMLIVGVIFLGRNLH